MANKVYQYYTELPSWAKGVVVIGTLGVVYFVGKSILDKIKANAEIQKQVETLNTQTTEINNLQKAGATPSFADSQYKQWSDGIVSQFAGCDIIPKVPLVPAKFLGVITNWSGSGAYFINIIDKFKNNLDFLKLSQAFGVRTYDQCGWGTGNFTGTLAQAVADELDDNEVTAINKVLSSKGITYTF
jgi:hypothetical protein